MKTSKLTDNFEVLATAKTKSGDEVVASFEHRKYPIISNQWHPEKHMFERSQYYDFIDRSSTLLEFTQAVIAGFVRRIRENGSPKAYSEMSVKVKERFSSRSVPQTLAIAGYEKVFAFKRHLY